MSPAPRLSARDCLPRDAADALLIGRAWVPAEDGPSVVAVRGDEVVDLTGSYPTTSGLLNTAAPARVRAAIKAAPALSSLEALAANSVEGARDAARPWLLAPADLHAVKASGVTFVASLLERVIEERAKGNPALADGARREIAAIVGPDLRGIKPGSPEAARVKEVLVAKGMWSQYLEVGIGPDAELFSKCPPMAAVGTGARVGVHPASVWSNPQTRSGAGDQPRRRDRRGRLRQRREPPRRGGAQRAPARPRQGRTTPPARWGRSSGCSTSASPSTTPGA